MSILWFNIIIQYDDSIFLVQYFDSILWRPNNSGLEYQMWEYQMWISYECDEKIPETLPKNVLAGFTCIYKVRHPCPA